MHPELIAEIRKAHPEAFAAKIAAGLTESQAAQVITAQIEHDAAQTPELSEYAAAKQLIHLANRAIATAQRLHAEATVRRAALNNTVGLPDLESLSSTAEEARKSAPKAKK